NPACAASSASPSDRDAGSSRPSPARTAYRLLAPGPCTAARRRRWSVLRGLSYYFPRRFLQKGWNEPFERNDLAPTSLGARSPRSGILVPPRIARRADAGE